MSLVVSEDHFAYLRLQRGDLWGYSGDEHQWLTRYNEAVSDDYGTIVPALPLFCRAFLDVGSGLSGVGVKLKHRWPFAKAYLLDGADDEPVVTKHHETFNSESVTRSFWEANGARVDGYHDASKLDAAPRYHADVVVSFRSWCFHYEPDTYIDFVRARCHAGTVLIVDVRRNRPKWIKQIERHFRAVHVIKSTVKFERIEWRSW